MNNCNGEENAVLICLLSKPKIQSSGLWPKYYSVLDASVALILDGFLLCPALKFVIFIFSVVTLSHLSCFVNRPDAGYKIGKIF